MKKSSYIGQIDDIEIFELAETKTTQTETTHSPIINIWKTSWWSNTTTIT